MCITAPCAGLNDLELDLVCTLIQCLCCHERDVLTYIVVTFLDHKALWGVVAPVDVLESTYYCVSDLHRLWVLRLLLAWLEALLHHVDLEVLEAEVYVICACLAVELDVSRVAAEVSL